MCVCVRRAVCMWGGMCAYLRVTCAPVAVSGRGLHGPLWGSAYLLIWDARWAVGLWGGEGSAWGGRKGCPLSKPSLCSRCFHPADHTLMLTLSSSSNGWGESAAWSPAPGGWWWWSPWCASRGHPAMPPSHWAMPPCPLPCPQHPPSNLSYCLAAPATAAADAWGLLISLPWLASSNQIWAWLGRAGPAAQAPKLVATEVPQWLSPSMSGRARQSRVCACVSVCGTPLTLASWAVAHAAHP